MGQKTHPLGFRLGYLRNWNSHWYAGKNDYARFVLVDHKVRQFILNKFSYIGIANIKIYRTQNQMKIEVYTSRPGVLIGRRGVEIQKLSQSLKDIAQKEVAIDVKELRNPETDAVLVAENIAAQLLKRTPFRRAMKKAISLALGSGVEGVKIICSGRLGGAEMARSEVYKQGKIPLHTLNAHIDYGFATSQTTYGIIGVKVWLYKGYINISKFRESRFN